MNRQLFKHRLKSVHKLLKIRNIETEIIKPIIYNNELYGFEFYLIQKIKMKDFIIKNKK